jgi:nitroimidazol reductase NimA-like FMN-containing flavoprotein (pyridoxamine 5'-phosphate oxidase superfamily)
MNDQVFLESRDEMEELLQAGSIGYLGLSMNGKPYVVPLNYSYSKGTISFHCALEGKKLDFIRANPLVCFTVGQQVGPVRDHAGGNLCHVDSDCVICYGTARIIEDLEERRTALNAFNRRFRPDAGYPYGAGKELRCRRNQGFRNDRAPRARQKKDLLATYLSSVTSVPFRSNDLSSFEGRQSARPDSPAFIFDEFADVSLY